MMVMVRAVNEVGIVLKPLEVNWVAKEFADISLTPVPILILYVVLKEMLAEDVTVKVLLSLESIGEEDICTQVPKLSEDTWKVPVQEVSEVLVVIDVLSIILEKVTEMDEVTDTDVSVS